MSDDNKNAGIDFMSEMTDRMGVACATVSDGHVITFKTSWLKDLLAKYGNEEKICLCIKRPDFKN
jgi:hypothetical protein